MPFTSRYDLVQVVQHPTVNGGSIAPPPSSAMAVGPMDGDSDGEVTTTDAVIFLGNYVSGAPLADYNSDGSIDALDVVDYFTDFANATP